MISPARFYLTEDKRKVVLDSDPSAFHLLVGEGCRISIPDLMKYGKQLAKLSGRDESEFSTEGLVNKEEPRVVVLGGEAFDEALASKAIEQAQENKAVQPKLNKQKK